MLDNISQVQLDITLIDGILALVRNNLQKRGHNTASVGTVASSAGRTQGHMGSAGDTDYVTSWTTGDRRFSGNHEANWTFQ